MPLQLVVPAAPLTSAPAVLTPAFQDRLASLNAATRELRGMGLAVVWSKLAGPVPQAHIRRHDAMSLSPLLDRMGPRSFRPDGACVVVSGLFMGIQLSWVEPKPQ
ncbi:hypothetical protein [Azonexus sp.]|uniref:hypothetical protein n=1 Tax=Azonexus sp. TaxID=1872668 RepID=UPI0027B8922E|nr:hypothetical protein [Azonexus sp.]